MKKQQTGGTIVGFIVGVIVGLGAALAVAVYVTKVPVPFLNRATAAPTDMDAAGPRRTRTGTRTRRCMAEPGPPAAPAVAAAASAPASAPAPEVRAAASAAKTCREQARRQSRGQAKAESKPGADPLGDWPWPKAAAKGSVDPFDYFVQAGAFRTQADADARAPSWPCWDGRPA